MPFDTDEQAVKQENIEAAAGAHCTLTSPDRFPLLE